MDEAAEKLLKHFCQACLTTTTMRPEDWRHLYRFTLDIHRRGLNTHHRTIRDYLIKHGCSLQKASWLSGQFRRFTELLACYDHEKPS